MLAKEARRMSNDCHSTESLIERILCEIQSASSNGACSAIFEYEDSRSIDNLSKVVKRLQRMGYKTELEKGLVRCRWFFNKLTVSW